MTTKSIQLVTQALDGDDAAFAALLRSCERPARGYAFGRLGDYQKAQDVVQEAALVAYQSLGSLREPARFASWFFGIVRNQCLRVLRRRDLAVVDLGSELPASRPAPPDEVQQGERRLWAVGAVLRLPPAIRNVAALYYLEGCTQQEVAGFLDLPVTTVNNRLHKARTLLRAQGAIMPAAPTPSDAPVVGTVLRSEGPILDVRFDADVRPEPFDALALPGEPPVLRVIQQVDADVVRCVRAQGSATIEPGTRVRNATLIGGSYNAPVCEWAQLADVVQALSSSSRDEIVETGIKAVDLFAPLPAGGTAALFGTEGVGKMVLTQELLTRLGGRANAPTFVYLGARSEPALVRDLQDGDAAWTSPGTDAPPILWIPSDQASDFLAAEGRAPFDASIYCTPLLAIQGLWPAVDPMHSRSAVAVSAEHADVADRARALLATTRQHTIDARLLELLTCRAIHAARSYVRDTLDERVAALPDAVRAQVQRGRRLEAYLTSPFEGAMTVAHGEFRVPLATTLRDVAAILDGAQDDTPLDDLRYLGALPKNGG